MSELHDRFLHRSSLVGLVGCSGLSVGRAVTSGVFERVIGAYKEVGHLCMMTYRSSGYRNSRRLGTLEDHLFGLFWRRFQVEGGLGLDVALFAWTVVFADGTLVFSIIMKT